MENFEEGMEVTCINAKLLPGNDNGPLLEEEKNYSIKKIILDSAGNQHLDVGLVSSLQFITSYETKEDLPDGNKVHWCHPSRFTKAN